MRSRSSTRAGRGGKEFGDGRGAVSRVVGAFPDRGLDTTSSGCPDRVLHGDKSVFEGVVRKNPVDKEEIVVAAFSCSSNQNRGPRPDMIRQLYQAGSRPAFLSPGDQSYDHKKHTAAWLLWGRQFREIIRDRPVGLATPL